MSPQVAVAALVKSSRSKGASKRRDDKREEREEQEREERTAQATSWPDKLFIASVGIPASGSPSSPPSA